MDSLILCLGRLLLSLLLVVFLLPVVWLICSPFILIVAACMSGPYDRNVKKGYQAVSEFWEECGVFLVP